MRMAQRAGVSLEDVAAIWEYAQWYLLMSQLRHWEDFLLIESVDQVCFLDEIDVDVTEWEERRKSRFLKEYRTRICQPHIHRVGLSATVEVFAIRNRTLEEHHVLIERGGALWHTLRVLETDLPLAVLGEGSSSLVRGYTWRES